MNKEFIPYEQALELKELCFNEKCIELNKRIEELTKELNTKPNGDLARRGIVISINEATKLLEKEKEKQYKWISVEDNFPEKDGKYLIFDGEYEVALFKNDRFIETYPTGIDEGPYTKCHYRQELFPTHWMPLPEPPKK